MENGKKSASMLKKVLIGLGAIIVGLVVIVGIVLYAIWGDEIATVSSMKLVRERNDDHKDGAVYTMHVKGGFYLDEFVEQGGVSNDSELIDFVIKNITKGIINVNINNLVVLCHGYSPNNYILTVYIITRQNALVKHFFK